MSRFVHVLQGVYKLESEWSAVRAFVEYKKSQSILCICNDASFDISVNNGVYGFPHNGSQFTKSFWRSIAAVSCIGQNDLVFLYRTSGYNVGCGRINGVFRIYSSSGTPAIYYDPESPDLQLSSAGGADCKTRLLFERLIEGLYFIGEDYEIVKCLESRDLWGFRHPAVMNIGAARKKSFVVLTHKQTLLMIDLLKRYGKNVPQHQGSLPARERANYYDGLVGEEDRFKIDETFLLSHSAATSDEAFMYSYLVYGLRHPHSTIHAEIIDDLTSINRDFLVDLAMQNFGEMTSNILLEVVISVHLQEELDVVLLNNDENVMFILEIKQAAVDSAAVTQVQKYLDLMKTIFPQKRIFANIIGGCPPSIAPTIESSYANRIRLAYYSVDASTGKRRMAIVGLPG